MTNKKYTKPDFNPSWFKGNITEKDKQDIATMRKSGHPEWLIVNTLVANHDGAIQHRTARNWLRKIES